MKQRRREQTCSNGGKSNAAPESLSETIETARPLRQDAPGVLYVGTDAAELRPHLLIARQARAGVLRDVGVIVEGVIKLRTAVELRQELASCGARPFALFPSVRKIGVAAVHSGALG
jgi:hypothetical protein